MINVAGLRPTPLIDTDKKAITRDTYYATFKKGVLWTSLITATALILLIATKYFNWGMPIELKDVTAVFTCGIVVVTCFYHAKNLRLNIDAHQKKLDFDYSKFEYEENRKYKELADKAVAEKCLFAFQLCREFNSPIIIANMHRARLFYLNDSLMQELRKIPHTNTEALKAWSKQFDVHPARKSVILILNFFEQIAIAIEKGFADENTCREFLSTVVVQYFIAYRSFIEYRQHDSERGSATFLTNFEDLAIKWSGGSLRKK